jgi:hypothetical protein
VEVAHLDPVPRAEHARREAKRRRDAEPPADAVPQTPETTFSIALFSAVDRPAVERRTVTLGELQQLLSRFEVLKDKRAGYCWSPTDYASSAISRGDAGVVAVSCLVFDLDRVPPDPQRLDGVHWMAHTTWSHQPDAPRWRLVLPIARPVPADRWRDVWQRARAALCPEADPSCKDASRQYFLPAHSPDVVPEFSYHPGELLNAATLPELPPSAPSDAPTRKVFIGTNGRRGSDHHLRQRAERYLTSVVANLASVKPGGRNTALNQAAWTLGRWIAIDALDQSEVEDHLYAAAKQNGLLADDGDRQTWATIRSGIGAGLQSPRDD